MPYTYMPAYLTSLDPGSRHQRAGRKAITAPEACPEPSRDRLAVLEWSPDGDHDVSVQTGENGERLAVELGGGE